MTATKKSMTWEEEDWVDGTLSLIADPKTDARVLTPFERRLCRRHPGGRFGRGAEPPPSDFERGLCRRGRAGGG